MRVEYTLEVTALCPADDRLDVYAVTVRATRTIPVEDILKAAAGFRERKVFQEELTAEFHRALTAEVESVGWHSGVRTVCTVGGPG
jgi:NADPH-dependent 7-cyano-7-deazaguanine reductase QueF